MDKRQAVRILTDAVKIYDEKFCDRNLLIVFGDVNKPSYIETKADDKNFYHLTGLILNENHLLRDISDKTSNPKSVFYIKAKQNRLSLDDFDFKDGNTEQKLRVLVQTLRLSSNAKMFGDYSGGHMNLKTDKIAGSVSSFLGFMKTGKYFVPNTVMSDDTRNNTRTVMRVLAVLSKDISDTDYNTIEAVGKKIDINRLIQKVSPSVAINPALMQSSNIQ